MLQDFSFHPTLVVRHPAFPFHSQFDKNFIHQCLSDNRFMEALYLASPELQEKCLDWQEGKLTNPKKLEKLLDSLVKYYTRISSRCTPFGLFAGCSVVAWDEKSDIRFDENHPARHTRLDMQYLCALSRQLANQPEIKEKLHYYPNTSIYQIWDEIRYIENTYVNSHKIAQVIAAGASEYLLRALAISECGADIAAIAAQLTSDSISSQEALSFVHELVDAQLLVSELEPTLTGQEFLPRMLEVLERIATRLPTSAIGNTLRTLGEVNRLLQELDNAVVNKPAQYQTIVQLLETLPVPMEKNKLFQTDMYMTHTSCGLNKNIQENIARALEVLGHLTPPRTNERLEHFKAHFLSRYENQELPLMDVLDGENGISYANQGQEGNTPLIEDLVLTDPDATKQVIYRGKIQQWLFDKFVDAQRNGSYSVEITQAEINLLPPTHIQLPPSVSVLFRVVDAQTFILESAGGSSAANLLGRFAHLDPAIYTTIKQITDAEQQRNPGVIFAEIVHLPENRAGNILLRPALRDFEIPYLAKSSVPPASQISLQDLMVSVRNNQVTLRSRQLNKVVVPRLSSAHNFSHESVPVYQFLCDLQNQGFQSSFGFTWESVFPGSKFLPRLNFQGVILHLATWQLQRQDFQALLTDKSGNGAAWQTFLKHWRLPRLFTLADGDNELLVDTKNPLTVKAWLDTIKNRDSIKLKEFIFNPDASLVKDSRGRQYVSQVLASLVRKNTCYSGQESFQTRSATNVQREFWLGCEWLYYKFYCGVKTSDRVLIDAIRPAAEALLDGRLIDKWFFVRYSDPEPHLRVRFHLCDTAKIGEVVQLTNQYIQPYMDGGYIWRNQTDTYQRELERYGAQTIEQTESLFFFDSMATVSMLEQLDGEERELIRWLWGIRSIDDLLNAFSYLLADKLQLIQQMREAFMLEFGTDKQLKLQLDTKYRNHKSMISRILDSENDALSEYAAVCEPLYRRNQQIQPITEQILELQRQNRLEIPLNKLLGSYIHMLINRIIPTNQRLHEVVVYDFLYRYYRTETAMKLEKT